MSTKYMSQAAIESQPNIKNALHGFEQTKGLARFFYGLCILFGVVFYGIGIITAFNVVSRIVSYGIGAEHILLPIFFSCYAILDFMLGSGFVFCRKWLIAAFSGNLILLASASAILFMRGDPVQGASLFFGIALSIFFVSFVFLGRKFLVGRYLEPRALVPFLFFLAASFSTYILFLIDKFLTVQ